MPHPGDIIQVVLMPSLKACFNFSKGESVEVQMSWRSPSACLGMYPAADSSKLACLSWLVVIPESSAFQCHGFL